jgi:hypothetical protein
VHNLLDPAILFFVFGVLAGTIRSNLEIPPAIARFLSLYLLMALGLKGGFALSHAGLSDAVGTSLAAAILLAVAIPLLGFGVLRRLTTELDAAAVAATYGSVSAVTFVTAAQYLDAHAIAWGGHMAAAMALMESPAIIMAVVLANRLRTPGDRGLSLAVDATTHPPSRGRVISIGKVLHESFTDGAQLLLIGSMAVGILTGDAGKAAMQPFSGDLFKGMLSFFLLDMGLMTARNLPALRGRSPALLAYAIIGPVVHALIALALGRLFALPPGDGALLIVLAASASYIAVPAVLRFAIPEANPSLYLGLSLGVTFPLNILVGIPVWVALARHVLS